MENSKIAWCDDTFNPWWGCVKVSDGCKHCYAETFAKRTGHDVWGVDAPRWFFQQKHWNEPLKWNSQAGKDRRRVFCGSMCDWAETHRNPLYQIAMDADREKLAWTIEETCNLDWLLLTKRIEDAGKYLAQMFPHGIPENAWIGTTTENQEQFDKRVPFLLDIPVTVRFISIEPQLTEVRLPHNGPLRWATDLHWVIVGGESGPGCRKFDLSWARSLRDDCQMGGVAFFMKQLGGHPDKHDDPMDFPEDLRIREFPQG